MKLADPMADGFAAGDLRPRTDGAIGARPGAVPRAGAVARAFGAATDYEAQAVVQRRVAAMLAARVAGEGPRAVRLLEVGCGTGLLTRALVAEGLRGDWLVTDIAPAMVARCAAAMGDAPGVRFAAMDGERPDVAGPFDVICASLAFQWFADLPGALARLAARLAPGGRLAFATLLDGTFGEWAAAHAAVGVRSGGMAYPDVAGLAAMMPAGGVSAIEVSDEVAAYADARGFVRAVKAIGAGTPRAGHQPLSAGAMRRAMRAFEAGGAAVTYRVGFCRWVRA